MIKTLLASAALLVGASAVQAEDFNFVLLGDVPYGKPETVFAPFETLIGAINARAPELVVHVGDTKSGSTLCDDAMLDAQLGYLNSFDAPTLYSLGDNEWTDCHRAKAGEFDPLERLDYIRSAYFADPATSFGKSPAPVESMAEAGYPENTRMEMNGVLFVATHVVGSNNNFEPRDIAAVEEFLARDAANIAWLKESFAVAAQSEAKAVVLAIHADMFEFDFNLPWDAEGYLRHSGFKAFAEALWAEANAFNKPVLLMYGDSHTFRMFRPFPKKAPTIMALETFGSANMHAVEVHVRPNEAFPFAVQPLINPAQPIAWTE
ncbi:hypothetical protein R3X27_13560 [Tropicimonas sp. TH_r6]|uniref:hypothetical protein n=1 Tax=Tropicimonas sp. TH_r6 TaxID=3082085 RepID=UPI002953651C|nr:hypothetical protein [Tropicimonas sp. TH_r6]MDV7143708.1 hypothetical protein [Tropicimonas sp. TH_r6]